jgi:hypothetical protein
MTMRSLPTSMSDMEQTELFPKMKGWYAAVAEQFTRFATVQVDGREVPNPTGQYENTSITQFIASKSRRGFNLRYWPFLPERRSLGSNPRNCAGERPTIRLNARLKSPHEGGFGESLPE